jgi:predicted nucleic acid-binding protein
VIGLTLDTGALIALERRRVRVATLIQVVRADGGRVTVPSVVIAEWWRGQRGPAARILDAFDIDPIEARLARTAGEALARIGGGVSAVDALVMASAAARGDRVLTSDVPDLDRLREAFPAVRLLGVGG